LTEKLDYIGDGDPATQEDLECSGIWTMPVFPSPTYHKYDVTDFLAIDPQYGSMEDFDAFLAAAHERNIRVILDLPLNHTSVEHPWFQSAAEYVKSLPAGAAISGEECPYALWYNFSSQMQEGYEPLDGGWYYEARFWSGMPDLNLDNEEVRDEIRKICEFWLQKGVDGFRLDAVTSYYTGDKSKNIDFLSWLNSMVKEISPEAYLVGEAWENQSVYAEYYKSGIDSLFDFRFSGADGMICQTVRGAAKASAYANALAEEEEMYASFNEGYVNAPFYTNHDMARSAGYYLYDHGNRIKLAGALNLLMTGNAFIYYGEEIGMKGSGKDENKRAPMYWFSSGGEGMCRGPEDMDAVEMQFPDVREQMADPYSIWNYYRNAVRLRNAFPVIAQGRTEVISELTGDQVCVFRRTDPEGKLEDVLIAVNTSEEEQTVKLTRRKYTPFELRGVLVTGGKQVAYEKQILTLPPFAAAVLSE
nr:alpha-amylase [Lachnospiraceae bacterium]